MNSRDPIGGFFELESVTIATQQHLSGILLNSGRACLEYLVRVRAPRVVYLPSYLCQAVVQPLQRMGVEYRFYELDDELEIAGEVNVEADALLLYINYFGIKNRYSHELASAYGERLVVDCSQAYFYEPRSQESAFYSPRKFFGVPDGGILLVSNVDTLPSLALEADHSHERMIHLLKRVELGPEAAFGDYRVNEEVIDSLPMRSMSTLTRNILCRVPFSVARDIRNENFQFLHSRLGEANQLAIDLNDIDGPNYYPFRIGVSLLRDALKASRIFSPVLWPPFRVSSHVVVESRHSAEIVPLPIDQRYGPDEMRRIVEIVDAQDQH